VSSDGTIRSRGIGRAAITVTQGRSNKYLFCYGYAFVSTILDYGHNFRTVAYGNGRFVAGGSYGTIAWSYVLSRWKNMGNRYFEYFWKHAYSC
jgi:hypothetical protein